MTQRRAGIALVLAATAAAAAGLYSAGGRWAPALPGLPDAGPATTWALHVGQLAGVVLGARIIGALVAACLVLPTTQDTISRDSVPLLRRMSLLSLMWAVVCITNSVLTLAVALGISARQAAAPGMISTYLWSLPASRDCLYAAGCALLVAALAPIASALNSVLGLAAIAASGIAMPLLASHSASLGDHSLAVVSTVGHGVAVSVWLGGLWAALPAISSGDNAAVRRFSALATACLAATGIAGIAAAYARLDAASDLWTSGYGRVVAAKVVLLGVIGLVAVRVRRAVATSRAALAAVELTVMGAAAGLGVALHNSPFSRTAAGFPSAAEELLGFAFPPAPTWRTMLSGWHPEWAMLSLIVMLGALYAVASVRTRVHPLRATSFALSLAVMGWATCSGVARYSMISFQAHMTQHMALSMLAPLLLVMSAPVSLALQALPAISSGHARSPRRWVASLLHSRYARIVTHPVVVLAVFVTGLYGVYFTPLFSTLMGSHTGHLFMEFHFLLTGLLFAFTVIGIDPAPRQLPHGARLIMVLVAMSAHAFFAIALMQAVTPIGSAWYSQVRPPWLVDPLADTYAGGGVAWALGEIPTLLLLVAVAVQWSRSDARLAQRIDREADRTGDAQLAEYNAHLAMLDRRDSAT